MSQSRGMYPALFICHGGGPMPILGDPGHKPMVDKWKQHAQDIVAKYGKPTAIAVVSAHYNTSAPEVGGAGRPEMWYDYYGFPKEGYTIQYSAPGNPSLAQEMAQAMKDAGLKATANPSRRYDHGVFVPLLTMFPDADIPVIPVSVLAGDSPTEHMKMGTALRPFRERGVFFLGSGSSMHHFGNLGRKGAGTTFNNALTEALTKHEEWSGEERMAALAKVETFAGFDEAHPPGAHEHLMPLLTLLGTAAGNAAKEVANLPFISANVRHYLFEN
ncbi:extradiol ring-cleavage dioxygenase class III protein subunit B [Angomonas deanei]|nr:extradiol ring-cleavage dioxygenase class III protein subunit B [Angomonas deanei]EPY38276.1 extradiol ring-cleavage dioxygenase class III protein subunit B [Angomonas deanei]|eukprot:EPY26724.1 extradiol ring-cleavage dioxygenase class III protein subunit B [Angomonas deanei]